VLHKSPNAIVTEAALALASGCDTVSFYWADGEKPERIEDYERFVKRCPCERLFRTSFGINPADLAWRRCALPRVEGV
jgi:hypothetical protein